MFDAMYKTASFENFKPERFLSQGSIEINGKEVPYKTVCEDNVFYKNAGKPIASIFSYTYIRTDVKDQKDRPVIFGFNGGPGASSMMVHIGFLGTKRLKYTEDCNQPSTLPPYEVIDNFNCLLDVADIVVVDPVATGYGLLLDAESADQFLAIEPDAEALLTFISCWLTKYGRWMSPKYLLGESYGCIRSAVAAGIASGGGKKRAYSMAFDGLILIGNSITTGRYFNQDIPTELSVLAFPTAAALNWYHRHPTQQPLETFVGEARAFAEREYLLALFRGNDLAPEEYADIRRRTAFYTGISEAYLDEHLLRFQEEDMVTQILREKGEHLSRYDGRITLPRFTSQMGTNFSTVKDDPATAKYGPYFHTALCGELFPALNIHLERDFVPSAALHGDRFVRETYDRLSGQQLSSAMRRCPGMRVFFASGWYDVCTQIGMAYYLINHAYLPKDRTFIKGYPSGHMLYIGEENIKALNDDIRTFLRGEDPSKAVSKS